MKTALLPANETERLSALYEYRILDTPVEEVFDTITRLAATICEVPVSLISLIDHDRQWFKSNYGFIDTEETSRDVAFCAHVILHSELMEITDTLEDERFFDNPLVANAPYIRFYAGIPLVDAEGYALGALCVMDFQPRTLSLSQRSMLKQLSEVILALLQAHKIQLSTQTALEQSERRFKDFAQMATDWFWETDADHRYTWFSANVEAVTGVPRAWHYGKTRSEIAADDTNSQKWQTHLAQLQSHQPFREFEMRRRGPDGVRWILSNGMPIFNEQGVFQGYRGTGADISARKKAEEKLHKREQQLRLITDSLPVLIAYYDTNQCYCFVNKTFERWYQRSRESILGLHLKDVLGIDAYCLLRPYLETALMGQAVSFEMERPDPSGELRYVQGFYTPQLNQNGETIGVYALAIDITEQKQIEETLFAEKERAQITLESIGDAVITTDADGCIEYLNPVAEKLTGWSQADAHGCIISDIYHIINEETQEPVDNPIARCLSEKRVLGSVSHTILIARNGSEYSIQDSVAPIRDRNQRILGTVLVFSDITGSRQLERELTHQATHDALTGLVNRREFEQRLQRVLDNYQQGQSQHALCYLDLDQFKIINDTCGHSAGDELLRQLAMLFQDYIRQRDTVARLGGDEFGILLEHCSIDQARRVAEMVRKAVETFRFCWKRQSFQVGVSIGLVPITAAMNTTAELLRAADSACYVAKDNGRNRIQIYDDIDQNLLQHHGQIQWVSRIQQAFDEDRLKLVFQPITPVNGSLPGNVHYELLLRMDKGDGEMLLPGSFLPAAERYHLITRIDRWVVRAALSWLEANPAHSEVLNLCSINLSGHSLGDENFQEYVLQQFENTRIPAEKICFEITETAAIANLLGATRFMKTLKYYGCRFALDDFGSGLSSFNYLKNLPVDFVKIDGVFIKDIADDPINFAMVRSINEIGQLMGKKTVAEFVENEAILAKLKELGVDYAQGYHVGYPQTFEHIELH